MGLMRTIFWFEKPDDTLPAFPYDLVRVPGAEAPEALEEERSKAAAQGEYALLLGDGEDVLVNLGAMARNTLEPGEILALAESIDADAWFAERARSDPEYFTPEHGRWPKAFIPLETLSSHLDQQRERTKRFVHIGRLPTTEAWQAPALLKRGDRNDCPSPQVHAALCRRWQELYGAEPAAITSDGMEFLVENPPQTREQAEELAMEHFLYCPDLVHRGVGSLCGLAAMLLNSHVWRFWWF